MSTRSLILLALGVTALVAAGIVVMEAATATRAVKLRIDGMHCASCAASLTNALERTPGVCAARVSFDTKTAEVVVLRYRGPAPAVLCEAIDEAGYAAIVAP